MSEIEWPPHLFPWEHVTNVMRQRIRSNVYPPGTKLSEVAIMQEFGIARGTVRKVMAALREERLIMTRPGLGSIVLPPPNPADAVID